MRLAYPLVVSALLFSLGVFGVLARRNAVLVLMSVELMLNAVNLNLVAFDAWWADALHGGQVLTLFVITIAAAEIGLGLAIVLLVFRNRGTSDLSDLGLLDERAEDVEYADDDRADDDRADDDRADDSENSGLVGHVENAARAEEADQPEAAR
ncbi:MAG: NADH-quinone oxidoreductase subunit NuoK [Jiangellaceae bacterium]